MCSALPFHYLSIAYETVAFRADNDFVNAIGTVELKTNLMRPARVGRIRA
jgi:hypothetical protein